ncbi:MAG: SsrA-binding protein SsrA-binding protein [Parcubacteria group bacterium]|nr:SsrA-binding protein SsrA-binding protein [Parcubacteria group bacterium]
MSATLIENKKARMRFEIIDTYAAGLELEGTEVKSLRAKRGSLEGARVVIRGSEAYMLGMSIPPFQVKNTAETYDPERTRKLLLNKKEIAQLLDVEAQKGLTIVPLEVYTSGRYLKVRIATARGKQAADKRETLKRKAAERDIGRVLKNR